MDERPEPPPEGRLISRAQKRARLSNRKAAERAGMSEGHWRAIVSGSRSISSGVWVPVGSPAETLARMAQVVGVTPEQLEEADRSDAAEELRALPTEEPPERDADRRLDEILTDPEIRRAFARRIARMFDAPPSPPSNEERDRPERSDTA